MRAVLSASTLVAAPRPRFAVHGTGGSFVKHGLDPQEMWLRGGGHPTDPGYGEDAPERFGTPPDAAGNATRAPTERGDYPAFHARLVPPVANGAAAPPHGAASAV